MFTIDEKSNISLYTQLYSQIRTKILKGDIKPGTKLPSSRKLSTELQISRNTVQTAYEQLFAEGFLLSRPRSGYYVEDFDQGILNRTQVTYSGKTAPDKRKTPSCKYDFQYGKLASAELPFSEWRKLTNKCLREYRENLAGYGPAFGETGLKAEILKYLHDYRDVNCTVDQIVIGAGTQFCLGLVCQLLGAKGSAIALEEPGYDKSRSTFLNYGYEVCPVRLDKNGLSVKKLDETRAAAVYVTPSHQYPTGVIMPMSRRLELVDWAIRHDTMIIEDDYSCHLRYNMKPIPCLQSLCSDKVIYIGSFSKFIFPSMRVSYMVLPQDLMGSLNNMCGDFPSFVPFMIQKPLELFMKEGYWESYLRKTTRQQKKKSGILVNALKSEFGNKISISGMNAGLHLLVQVNWPMEEEELISRALRMGVKIYPTSKYWSFPHKSPYGTVLLGFGEIAPEHIPPAVRLLRKAWLGI